MIRTARDRNNPFPSDNFNLSNYIRIGKVVEVFDKTRIDNKEKYGCIRIIWADIADPNNTNSGEVIQCLTPGASWTYGSGIYRLPHVNDLVAALQLPNTRPIVIGYIPYQLQQAIAVNEDLDASSEVGSLPPLASGEILLKSSGQNEVLLSNDNVVRVITRDASSVNTIYQDAIQPIGTEEVIRRVHGGTSNISSIFTLGSTNKSLGCGTVVAELDIPSYTEEVTNITIDNLTDWYKLTLRHDNTPERVEYIVHTRGNKSTEYDGSECGMRVTYSYTKSQANSYIDANIYPLTLDNPTISIYITLPARLQKILKIGDVIQVTLLCKSSMSNLQFNNLGDCQLVGRNIVLKNNKNVSLGLFDDGSLRMSAKKTEIGDSLTGNIKLSKAGISMCPGIMEYASIKSETIKETKERDEVLKSHLQLGGTDQVSGRHYFALTEFQPLFCYDTTDKKIKVVSQDEYDALDFSIRMSIPYTSLDQVGPLTKKIIDEAVSEAQKAQILVKTYGELKA